MAVYGDAAMRQGAHSESLAHPRGGVVHADLFAEEASSLEPTVIEPRLLERGAAGGADKFADNGGVAVHVATVFLI